MVLYGEKTLKTTIRKNLSKSQKFAVILLMILKLMILRNFILKLHIQSPKLFGACVGAFCANSQRVKAVGYVCRRAPSWMFHRILNATLTNNLL